MANIHYNKLIVTVTRSLSKETTLSKLINIVNIFRANVADIPFDDYQKKYINTIIKLDNSKTILLETKWEEVFVQNTKNIYLEQWWTIRIEFSWIRELENDNIFVNYPYLQEVKEEVTIWFTDSDVVLEVFKSINWVLTCYINKWWIINYWSNLKFSWYRPRLSFLSEKDKKDIIRWLNSGVNMIAADSVKRPENIDSIREFLRENNWEDIKVFVRVNTLEIIKNLDEIIKSSDGIFCNHGELSEYINWANINSMEILKKTKLIGKPFVCCIDKKTFEKNKNNLDTLIGNYVDAWCDVFMLEEYFVEDDKVLESILKFNDILHNTKFTNDTSNYFKDFEISIKNKPEIPEYIIYEAYRSIQDIDAKAIICYTDTWWTVSRICSLRPNIPIIAFTRSDPVYRYINMLWWVKWYKISQSFNYENFKQIWKEMIRILFKWSISLDDKIIVLQVREEWWTWVKHNDMINGIELYKFKDI